MGAANETCSQFVRFFVLTFGASPFGGRAVAVCWPPYCVCGFVFSFRSVEVGLKMICLSTNHPRRAALACYQFERFSFLFSRLVPVLAEGS